MVKRNLSLGLLLSLLVFFPAGCYRYANLQQTNAAEIPDVSYHVYVYDVSTNDKYAVLFAVPNGEKRVLMKHLAQVEDMGIDRKEPYIAEFQKRIKNFQSALRITDTEGVVRGYLMITANLNWSIGTYGNDILVYVYDPSDYSTPSRFRHGSS